MEDGGNFLLAMFFLCVAVVALILGGAVGLWLVLTAAERGDETRNGGNP